MVKKDVKEIKDQIVDVFTYFRSIQFLAKKPSNGLRQKTTMKNIDSQDAVSLYNAISINRRDKQHTANNFVIYDYIC
jgi:hypothetical protein